MTRVLETMARLRPGLIPVPAVPQGGVCRLCHSSAPVGYAQCFPCHSAAHLDPPEILPISMSVDGEHLHQHLRDYKGSRHSGPPRTSEEASDRKQMTGRLAALTALFLSHHEGCIGPWDLVTAVPSERRSAPSAIIDRVGRLRDGEAELLHVDAQFEKLDPRRFVATRDLSGTAVLLVDDTFTSGASLFGAAAALRSAGASVAGPLVIGRHIRRDWDASHDLLSWLENEQWDELRCCRCSGLLAPSPTMPL